MAPLFCLACLGMASNPETDCPPFSDFSLFLSLPLLFHKMASSVLPAATFPLTDCRATEEKEKRVIEIFFSASREVERERKSERQHQKKTSSTRHRLSTFRYTIGNRFGRKDPLLARATSPKFEQRQQTKLMKTNPVGAADSAYIAEKKGGVTAICEEKYTFKRLMWSTRSSPADIHVCLCLPCAVLLPSSALLPSL
jgi:hypothetical protein